MKIRESEMSHRRRRLLTSRWTLLLSLLLLLLGWHGLVAWAAYPPFILPGPVAVWDQFWVVVADGRLLRHSLITVSQVIPGLLIGLAIATPLGYLLAKSPLAERLISPYLIASQAIPIIAVAPLLSIWVRSTYWSRVMVAVIVVFFPILINIIAGLRAVPAELYELMHSLRASRGQIFRQLELPAALPILLAGIKVGLPFPLLVHWLANLSSRAVPDLGFLLLTARYQFKTDLVFVVFLRWRPLP
jgi:NitT/TauT family transport system permease protein